MRLLLLCAALLLTGIAAAQEDLGWLTGLLPSGGSAGLEKLLRQGEQPVIAGRVLLEVPFEAPDAWSIRNTNYGSLRIQDGQYIISSELQDLTLAGPGGPVFRNTLVEVHTRQLSAEPNNGYGLVCRANAAGAGYYFFISGDGYYRIAQQTGSNMLDLVAWTASPVIHQGQDAENHLAAVCFDDYLALYVNGTLLAQVRTNLFVEGQVGMMGATYVDGNPVEIAFDNLRVLELLPPGGTPPPDQTSGDQVLADMLRSSSQPVELVRLLHEDPFDQQGFWEYYEDEDGNRFVVEDGLLRGVSALGNAFIYRTQNNVRYTDVVVQVDTRQISEEPNNGYGILCRASPQRTGRGYYLYISGDGYASLIMGDGNDFNYAVDWVRHETIQLVGQNLLTAVCVGDYLALYANNTLLFEHRDGLYTSGNVGFSVLGFPEGAYTEIEFDNLRIWEARPVR